VAELGFNKPLIIFNKVVFPEPFLPVNNVHWWAGMARWLIFRIVLPDRAMLIFL
jgi:hypothetical protein